MSDTVEEWVRKGQADLATAAREMDAKENANPDAVCFHAQQCVEKILKGLAIDWGLQPPKSHDLVTLADLLRGVIDLSAELGNLRFLTHGAVVFRYPGDSATEEEAREAYGLAVRLRSLLMPLFRSEGPRSERASNTQ